MKKILLMICLLVLVGCKSTVPSTAITNNAIKELNGVTEAVEHIQATTPAECKTDALAADLRAILTQVNGVSGQIKNIELACKTEKKVLESEKRVREIVIICLVLGILGYAFLRRRLT